MKHLSTLALTIMLAGCCLFGENKTTNQQCNFAKSVCENNIRSFKKVITKFYADGGMYIIKDINTGETLENTSVGFDENTIYETYFPKINFENKTSPEKLLNKYINLVQTSGKGLHQKLRENVIGGTGSTGRKSNVENAEVYGITATTPKDNEKIVITTFLGHFKYADKNYAFIFVMDEPKGITPTYLWNSAGWNIVPTAGDIIKNIVK